MNIVITYQNSIYIGSISKKDYEFILFNRNKYFECLMIDMRDGYINGINGSLANIFFNKDKILLHKFTKIKFNEKININRYYINLNAYKTDY